MVFHNIPDRAPRCIIAGNPEWNRNCVQAGATSLLVSCNHHQKIIIITILTPSSSCPQNAPHPSLKPQDTIWDNYILHHYSWKIGPQGPSCLGRNCPPPKSRQLGPGAQFTKNPLKLILMQPTRGTVQQVGFWCRQVQDFWHGRPWYHQSRSTMWSRSSMKV